MRFAICRMFGLECARSNVTDQQAPPAIHWSELDQKYWIATDEEPLWFEGILDAKRALREMELQHAAKAERDRIVAWLREPEWNYDNHLADAIEAGEHLK